MRLIRMASALCSFAVALAAAAYGIWLLATPDYDGGRSAVGWVVVASACLVALVGALLLRFRRRHSRA